MGADQVGHHRVTAKVAEPAINGSHEPSDHVTGSRGLVSGLRHDWEIWDGTETTFVGDLTPDLRRLEMTGIHGAPVIEERILSGRGEGDYWF